MNTIKTYAFVITNTQTGEQFYDVTNASTRSYAKAKMTKRLPKYYIITEVVNYEAGPVSLVRLWRLPCLNQHMCNNSLTPYKGFRFVRQMFNLEGELKHTSTWRTKKQALNGYSSVPDGYSVKVFQI